MALAQASLTCSLVGFCVENMPGVGGADDELADAGTRYGIVSSPKSGLVFLGSRSISILLALPYCTLHGIT